VKYDFNGTVLWASSIGGAEDDIGQSVCTDANNNAYLTGSFSNDTITIGVTSLSNAGSSDIFIAKYDAAGNVLWAKSAGGIYGEGIKSVSTDSSGNVYVTGNFNSDTLTFGLTTLVNAGNNDIFISKYTSNGTLLWAKSAGGNNYDSGQSISNDANGNVYVTGWFGSNTITFETATLINSGGDDIFIVKYSSNGTLLWAKSAGGITIDRATSISSDKSGTIYITGYFDSPTIIFDATTLSNAGAYDILILKYDANGEVLSARSPGGVYHDVGYGIFTDASKNIYLTGYFQSPTITFGTNTLTNSFVGYNSIFIVKYAATGTGVDDFFGNNQLNISPNPTSSTITLTIPKLINTNISITNLTGKQVATYKLLNTTCKTIDVSHLAEGVYFVTLKSDEGVVTKKMVKTN